MKLSIQRPRARNWRLRDSEHVWGPRALLRLSPEIAGEREQNHEKISTSRRMGARLLSRGETSDFKSNGCAKPDAVAQLVSSSQSPSARFRVKGGWFHCPTRFGFSGSHSGILPAADRKRR
jgi:hypothetical protein